MSSKFDSLSIRLGEREVTADVLNNLFNFRDVVRSLSESAGPEGIGRQEIITREELEEVVCATYCLEQFTDVDTAVDKKYQSRELLMAYDLAVRHKEELKTKGLRFDEFMKVLRVKSSTSSKLKMLAVKGDTVEARVKNFIIGETNDGMPTEKSVKLALFVANGVIPTQRLSSAPVESKILNGLASSENWYCEMRMNARAALILANFAIPLFITEDAVPSMERDDASDSKDAFDVSIIASKAKALDDSPRAFGGLVPLAHTEYHILVQTREGPPRVVKKRFSDFKIASRRAPQKRMLQRHSRRRKRHRHRRRAERRPTRRRLTFGELTAISRSTQRVRLTESPSLFARVSRFGRAQIPSLASAFALRRVFARAHRLRFHRSRATTIMYNTLHQYNL